MCPGDRCGNGECLAGGGPATTKIPEPVTTTKPPPTTTRTLPPSTTNTPPTATVPPSGADLTPSGGVISNSGTMVSAGIHAWVDFGTGATSVFTILLSSTPVKTWELFTPDSPFKCSTRLDSNALLTKLKNEYEVTEAILRESKAGLAVGKLRQHASKDVADIAKEIVKKWKTQVEKAKLANGTKVQPPTGKAIEQILKREQSLEKTIYNNHNSNVNAEYKKKMRTLFVNLKHKNNPELREGVVIGEL
ncbi:hypothetical protein DXG01_008643 [Tephrocybe rancida]|nr:hypothetical protein DXG01_008643 [Tephrocybe rancida]